MKLWQLVSIMECDMALMSRVAAQRADWKTYELMLGRYEQLVQSQDRAVLDSVVETDFAIAVLKNVRRNLHLSADNQLRSWPFDPYAQVMSVLEAVTRYGGDIVEDVLEKGSYDVTHPWRGI